MIDKIKEYIGEAELFTTDNKEALEAFRIKFLSKKGILKVSQMTKRRNSDRLLMH